MTAPTGPLAGVRVLDMTSVVMGPLATQMLGDLGADVIVVERRRGDTNRAMGPGPAEGMSGTSLNLMRNKRSITVDLKAPEGRDIVLELAATCDVVVTNLRPGPLQRLGLAYDDVVAVRPDVVFCQAHGWPSDSPDANRPAYDDIIQSASGVGDLFGKQGHAPNLIPTIVADKVAGHTIVAAVTAALFHRSNTGNGQHIEIPMIDTMRAFVLVEHGAGAIAEPPQSEAGYQRVLSPNRRPQQTLDGWVNVLPYSPLHYNALFAAGGRDDLVDDERFATRDAMIANANSLYGDIAAMLVEKPTAWWLDFCEENAVPATAMVGVSEMVDELPLAEHPAVGTYRQIPPPMRFSATPASIHRHASFPGGDTDDVLSELGVGKADLDRLKAQRVITQGRSTTGT